MREEPRRYLQGDDVRQKRKTKLRGEGSHFRAIDKQAQESKGNETSNRNSQQEYPERRRWGVLGGFFRRRESANDHNTETGHLDSYHLEHETDSDVSSLPATGAPGKGANVQNGQPKSSDGLRRKETTTRGAAQSQYSFASSESIHKIRGRHKAHKEEGVVRRSAHAATKPLISMHSSIGSDSARVSLHSDFSDVNSRSDRGVEKNETPNDGEPATDKTSNDTGAISSGKANAEQEENARDTNERYAKNTHGKKRHSVGSGDSSDGEASYVVGSDHITTTRNRNFHVSSDGDSQRNSDESFHERRHNKDSSDTHDGNGQKILGHHSEHFADKDHRSDSESSSPSFDSIEHATRHPSAPASRVRGDNGSISSSSHDNDFHRPRISATHQDLIREDGIFDFQPFHGRQDRTVSTSSNSDSSPELRTRSPHKDLIRDDGTFNFKPLADPKSDAPSLTTESTEWSAPRTCDSHRDLVQRNKTLDLNPLGDRRSRASSLTTDSSEWSMPRTRDSHRDLVQRKETLRAKPMTAKSSSATSSSDGTVSVQGCDRSGRASRDRRHARSRGSRGSSGSEVSSLEDSGESSSVGEPAKKRPDIRRPKPPSRARSSTDESTSSIESHRKSRGGYNTAKAARSVRSASRVSSSVSSLPSPVRKFEKKSWSSESSRSSDDS